MGVCLLKKVLMALMAFVLLLSNCLTVLAAEKPIVYSDEVYAALKESFTVPIKLKNNEGLMGFKITVKYPEAQIALKDISSGSLTKSGMFNTTVTDYYSVKGSFDVIWSDTQNVSEDGTLFMLTFETLGYADYGKYKIDLTYSADDTFNEKWKAVQLDCQSITVNILDSKSASKKNEVKTTLPSNNSGKPVSDDYLISSVKAMLESYQIVDISDVSDDAQKDSFLKFVNSRNLAYSKDAVQFRSFDELREAYIKALKNSATKNVLESVDGEKVISISDRILKKYGAGSFSELSNDKKEAAVESALGSIAGEGGDTRDFAKILDNDTAADVLDGIVNGAKEEQNNSVPVKSKHNFATWKIVLIAVAFVVIVIVLVGFIYLRKKGILIRGGKSK